MLLFFDEALWDEQGKRDVLMAGRLEAAVERALNVFPQRPAVRADNHAAAHWRIVRQLRFQNQLVVPLGKILCPCRKLFFGHSLRTLRLLCSKKNYSAYRKATQWRKASRGHPAGQPNTKVST